MRRTAMNCEDETTERRGGNFEYTNVNGVLSQSLYQLPRRIRASTNGDKVDGSLPEGDEESVGSVDTDFALNDTAVDQLTSLLGRDSIKITQDKNIQQTKDSVISNGVDGVDFDEDEESLGTTSTGITLSDSVIRQFTDAFGRDSLVVTREKNVVRRRSRASIKNISIEFATLEEEEE
mmetsp:Transcript_40763/g.61751  ORF Transcript_40763/g.61751 Transcript_40763/m.61751 type:complete len:178 (+) Transcript_40763:90-623(+)